MMLLLKVVKHMVCRCMQLPYAHAIRRGTGTPLKIRDRLECCKRCAKESEQGKVHQHPLESKEAQLVTALLVLTNALVGLNLCFMRRTIQSNRSASAGPRTLHTVVARAVATRTATRTCIHPKIHRNLVFQLPA